MNKWLNFSAINWVILRNIKSTQKCKVMSTEEHTRLFWPPTPICSHPCLYSFSLSHAILSWSKMRGLPLSQDNLVIDNLVIECFQLRKVLLMALCGIHHIYMNTKFFLSSNLWWLLCLEVIVFHRKQNKQTNKQKLAYLVKLSQLFSLVTFP